VLATEEKALESPWLLVEEEKFGPDFSSESSLPNRRLNRIKNLQKTCCTALARCLYSPSRFSEQGTDSITCGTDN
jgi:hypothetical protein